MAQSFTFEGTTLITPQAVASYKVETTNSGLGTTGVLLLVGEADAGPRFSIEEDLSLNAFGPDQVAAVQAKYGSGPLVDAFRAATAPTNDPNITGSFFRAILVKTNDSTKAKQSLTVYGGGDYESADASALVLADRGYGKNGNLIYTTITAKAAEVVPTTGAFTALVPTQNTAVGVRVNGGTQATATLTVGMTPAQVKTTLDAVSGIVATGGTARGLLAAVPANTLALTVVSGNAVQIDSSTAWAGTTPVAGDTVYIPATSALASVEAENAGSYVVTAATATTIYATKLLDVEGSAPGALTAPTTQVAIAAGDQTDIEAWSTVTVSADAIDPILGVGKSIEINELTSATELVSNLFYVGTTKVSWISKTVAAKQIVSATEYRAQLNVNRQRDNISEELIAGGEIALKVGYLGTTATLTIDDTTLTTTVTGGAGANLSLDLADFPVIQDVATFIASKPGYTATVGTTVLGQLPSTALDNVTSMGICSTFGEQPGRLKIDGYRFAAKVNNESVLVQLQDEAGDVMAAGAGLPQPVTAVTYLAGGSKGGTTDADVLAAFEALERVRGNFVVPLFSRDASSDIQDKLTSAGGTYTDHLGDTQTETASSYTITAINANARAHVLKMSTLKKARNRQAFISLKDTFANAKLAAANTANFRCFMSFQDVRNVDSTGSIKQFQPWMGSVLTAAGQAAAFYKALVRKFANMVGAVQAARDFSDQDDTQIEDALLAGLTPFKKAETGGWYWVSDQTTYGKDNNFVFNSIQATYAADIIAMTTASRMENAFVGQSTADISAPLALAFLDTLMGDFLKLKLIAASDDAPRGYKNASIKISRGAMLVNCEVKLATAIYWVPISFLVSQVEQSA